MAAEIDGADHCADRAAAHDIRDDAFALENAQTPR